MVVKRFTVKQKDSLYIVYDNVQKVGLCAMETESQAQLMADGLRRVLANMPTPALLERVIEEGYIDEDTGSVLVNDYLDDMKYVICDAVFGITPAEARERLVDFDGDVDKCIESFEAELQMRETEWRQYIEDVRNEWGRDR